MTEEGCLLGCKLEAGANIREAVDSQPLGANCYSGYCVVSQTVARDSGLTFHSSDLLTVGCYKLWLRILCLCMFWLLSIYAFSLSPSPTPITPSFSSISWNQLLSGLPVTDFAKPNGQFLASFHLNLSTALGKWSLSIPGNIFFLSVSWFSSHLTIYILFTSVSSVLWTIEAYRRCSIHICWIFFLMYWESQESPPASPQINVWKWEI